MPAIPNFLIMPSPFATRDAQTRIKHSILKDYAGAFLSIIGSHYRRYVGQADAGTVSFAYVDGFAGQGRYGRDTDGAHHTEPIWGSPIIGMKAFEEAARPLRAYGVQVNLSGIIVEEDRENFDALVQNVALAGLSTPHQVVQDIRQAEHGKINLLHADFRALIPALVPWLGRHYTLALVDPYGTGMPMSALRPLLARERTDAIVLFPFMDVDRKGASVRKLPELRTPGDNGNVTRVRAVFEDAAWEAIAKDLSLDVHQREAAYEELYGRCLQRLDPALVVKNIPLRLSAAVRTVYYLFLTTRDPDGALRMNSILRSANLREHFALYSDMVERRRLAEEARGEISLFEALGVPLAPPAAPTEQLVIDRDELKRVIRERCPPGTVLTLKDLRRRMANDVYLEAEIGSALTALKAEGAVQYTSAKRVTDVLTFV